MHADNMQVSREDASESSEDEEAKPGKKQEGKKKRLKADDEEGEGTIVDRSIFLM